MAKSSGSERAAQYLVTDSPAMEKKAAMEEMYKGYKKGPLAGVPELTAEELKVLLEDKTKNVVVVDVRMAEEQNVSMIPGSLRKEEFEERESELTALEDTTVVAYCTIGYRSGKYVQQLAKRGVFAYNLRGSVLAWTHAGYELVEGNPGHMPTKQVHVFGKTWDLAGEGYKAVWFDKTPWGKLIFDKITSFFRR